MKAAFKQKLVIEFIPKSNEEERAGVAWALSNGGNFRVEDLLPVLTDDEAKKWIAWIIGTQKEADYIDQIEQLKDKDKEVYFAMTVLWKILSSWISRLDVYYRLSHIKFHKARGRRPYCNTPTTDNAVKFNM